MFAALYHLFELLQPKNIQEHTSARPFHIIATTAPHARRCIHGRFTYCISIPSCSLMTSSTFWSDACYHARGRPLQAMLDAAYASCGVTVR